MVSVVGPGAHLDVTLLRLAGVIDGQNFLISSAVNLEIDSRDPEHSSRGVDDNIVNIKLARLEINLSIEVFLAK